MLYINIFRGTSFQNPFISTNFDGFFPFYLPNSFKMAVEWDIYVVSFITWIRYYYCLIFYLVKKEMLGFLKFSRSLPALDSTSVHFSSF